MQHQCGMSDKERVKAMGVASLPPFPRGKQSSTGHDLHVPHDSTLIGLSNKISYFLSAIYWSLIFLVVWVIIKEGKHRVILSHPLPAWCSLITKKARPQMKGLLAEEMQE